MANVRVRQPELTCKELVEWVTDYMEDALSPADLARVVEHLAECEGCDRYVWQMRETIGALGAMKADAVTLRAQARLREMFREWKKER